MTQSPQTPLVKARDILKVYGATGVLRRTAPTYALDGVNLDVFPGEVVALIGESGSGKTTLGKVLLRLTSLDAGTVEIAGEDVFKMDRRTLRQRRRNFQMVFQNQLANLHPKMTVQQMLDESLRLHRPDLDAAGRAERTAELLGRVSLTDHADQRPINLSGGERRRVGVARILATRPQLIVADEPTSGLDAAIKLQIIDLLRKLKEESLTYLLISHDLGLVRRIADRVVVMLKGRVIEQVPASQLGKADHHPYTGKLMQAADLLGDRREAPRERRDPLREPTAAQLKMIEDEPRRGCVHARDCQRATRLGILDQCVSARPTPVELGPGHWVACFGAVASTEDKV